MSTVACILSTAANVGVLINNAVYYWLANGIKGYYLFVMLSTCVAHLLGLLQFCIETPIIDCMYENILSVSDEGKRVLQQTSKKGKDTDYGTLHNLDSTAEDEKMTPEDNGNENAKHSRSPKAHTSLAMFSSVRYQLVMWSTSLLKGLKFLTINNINIFLVSMRNDTYVSILPFVSPAVSILTNFPLGKLVHELRSFRVRTHCLHQRYGVRCRGLCHVFWSGPVWLFIFCAHTLSFYDLLRNRMFSDQFSDNNVGGLFLWNVVVHLSLEI